METPQTNNKSGSKTNILYIAADGGCSGNGKPNVCATWAFCIIDSVSLAEETRDLFDSRAKKPAELIKDIGATESAGSLSPGSTNNQGELTAILRGVDAAITANTSGKNIIILSDSKYSINCVTEFYPKWVRDKSLHTKKNVDLISRIFRSVIQLRKLGNIVNFKHIRGHKSPPADFDDWLCWYLNNRVDYFCNNPDEC